MVYINNSIPVHAIYPSILEVLGYIVRCLSPCMLSGQEDKLIAVPKADTGSTSGIKTSVDLLVNYHNE